MVIARKRWYDILIEDRQQPEYGATLDVHATGIRDALRKTLQRTETPESIDSFKRKKGKSIEYLSKETRIVIKKRGEKIHLKK